MVKEQTVTQVPDVDENGDPKVDEEGNPIMKDVYEDVLDPETGKPKYIQATDENGDPTAFADTLGSVVQWISGVLVAFFTNKLWVFTNAEKGVKATFKQLLIFSNARVATCFVEWGINLGIIALLDRVFSYNAPTLDLIFMDFEITSRIWAKVISSIIVVITNYYISKLVVFRKKKQAQCEAECENGDNEV